MYVAYGGSALPSVMDLASDSDVIIHGVDPGDRLGTGASASSDVDGDGYDDLLLGAQYADGPGNTRPDAGEVYVVYGGALPAAIDLASYPYTALHAGDPGDHMPGLGLSTGDLNHDGYADIVIGAPDADGPGNARVDAGEAYVVFGGPVRRASVDLVSQADVVIYGTDPGDQAGSDTAVADLNGDGHNDIVIGAKSADGPNNTRPGVTGEVYVILGGPTLLPVYDLG